MKTKRVLFAVATAAITTIAIAGCAADSQSPDTANEAASPNEEPRTAVVTLDFASNYSSPTPNAQAWGTVTFGKPGVDGHFLISTPPGPDGKSLSISKVSTTPSLPEFNCRPATPQSWTCKPALDGLPETWRVTNFSLGINASASEVPRPIQIQFLLDGVDPIASESFTVKSDPVGRTS